MRITGNKTELADAHNQKLLEVGMRMAKSKDFVLWESKSDKSKRWTMGRLMEGLERKSDHIVAGTALMLRNLKEEIEAMGETTRTLSIGDFDKYAYPMVRAVFPNLIAHEIVSVQPMLGPTSLIFFMKFIRENSKGSALAGQNIHENPAPFFGSEKIDAELLTFNAGARYTGVVATGTQLKWRPVKPGSFKASTVDAGGNVLTVMDDGNGNIVGNVGGGAATRTMDYSSGNYDFDFSAAPAVTGSVYCSYVYDAEGNPNLPSVGMTISSDPVVAELYKMTTSYSLEAAQDLRSLQGLDADTELTAGLSNEIRFEIDRLILGDLRAGATSPGVTWPLNPPAGVDFTQYKLNFIDALTKSSNSILQQTQRAQGTWIVCGISVFNLISTLPGFKPTGTLTGRGVWKVGRLNNWWDVYVDTYMPSYDFTIGYKGESMFETGYVFSPYVLLYTTPPIILPDGVSRKGIASRFGRKFVDGRFFTNNTIDRTGVATGSPLI